MIIRVHEKKAVCFWALSPAPPPLPHCLFLSFFPQFLQGGWTAVIQVYSNSCPGSRTKTATNVLPSVRKIWLHVQNLLLQSVESWRSSRASRSPPPTPGLLLPGNVTGDRLGGLMPLLRTQTQTATHRACLSFIT